MNIKPYLKAVVGGVVAALTTAGAALSDGVFTPVEIITTVLAFIAGTGIVYAVPNTNTSTDNDTE